MSGAIKQKQQVRTNAVKQSICKVSVPSVTFAQLWDNYVTGNPYDDPTGTYANQCAIRMSATLHRIGIEMKSFSQKLVEPAPGKASLGRILLDGKATATRADEMASWLSLQPFCGLPSKPENVTGQNWQSKVKGRTGILFFGAYWTQDGESAINASGGHIDLWNKDTLTPSVESFMRFRLGINRVPNPFDWVRGRERNWYSDLGKARQILFWEIK